MIRKVPFLTGAFTPLVTPFKSGAVDYDRYAQLIEWQIEQAMKAQHLSRKGLAERMGTSRSQITRLLDPKDGNVTLLTLQRAAEMIGRKVRLELV